jgi:peptide chain release factor 3
VIGMANAAALRPGDTLYRDVAVQYPPIPSFSRAFRGGPRHRSE